LEKETLLWSGDHFKLQVGINRYAQDSTIMMLGTIFLAILMGELHIVKDVMKYHFIHLSRHPSILSWSIYFNGAEKEFWEIY